MDEDTGKQQGGPRLGRGPVAVGGIVSAVTRPMMRGRQAAVARLALDWPTVVGPALAAVTEPLKLSGGAGGGTLTIRASGPMALELSHLAPELIARINRHLGRNAVARLSFGAGRRTGPPALPPPLPRPPAPPREARARAEAAVSGLPEGPLREALARLGAHLMARR